ncbi:MAG: hypothetical protein AAGG07_06440 [Planctomycetota bacterium]
MQQTWLVGGAALISAAMVVPAANAALFVRDVDYELVYTEFDVGQDLRMEIDIASDGETLFEFSILNEFAEGVFWMGGLDPTRSGGFLTSFDENDYGVFQTFEFGAQIGPDNEDDIGFETFTYAQYDFDFGAETGGGLENTSQYVAFSYGFDLYGWMAVEFGTLEFDLDRPESTFIRVTQIGYQTEEGMPLLIGVPSPGSAVLMGAGFATLSVRRRR